MFKKIIQFIDSFGDYINPIIVRDFRRCIKEKSLDLEGIIGMINCYFSMCILTAAVFIILLIVDPYSDTSEVLLTWLTVFLMFAVFMISGINIIISTVIMANMANAPLSDDMFFTIPLSPRQRMNAYLGTSMLWSIFIVSFSFPFAAIYQVAAVNDPFNTIVLFSPIISILTSLVLSLIMISFIAQKRTAGASNPTFMEGCLMIIFAFVFLLSISIPLQIGIGLWLVFKLPNINIFNGFGFISLYILLPLGLAGYGIIAYNIGAKGFKPSYRTNWLLLWRNLLIYLILAVIYPVLYFIIAIIYFSFV
ncbi:MAG: hypothetical protein LBE18_11500 [Planctomycetaceae bacterium]|jgi:hypothetical protein|nr:hypothetical protein [Planctomycetaceae bacterium]